MFHKASKFINNFQELSVDWAANFRDTIEFRIRYLVPNRGLVFLSSRTSLKSAVFAIKLERVNQGNIVFDSGVIHASLNASEQFDFELFYG